MSNKHTPWSRSRHRAGLSADQFGSLDPRVVQAAINRPFGDRPAVAGPPESVRLLGSAAQKSGGGHDVHTVAGVSGGDDPARGTDYTRKDYRAGERPGEPSSDVEPTASDYGPVGTDFIDLESPRTEPDPVTSAPYSAPPPFPRPETVRSGDYPAPQARQADAAWSIPETEALELLPSGGHALLGLCIGIAVLLAVGAFYLGRTSGPNQAAAPTAATAVSTMTSRGSEAPTQTESPDIGAGFAWGKVLSNDGSTLVITSEINHSEIVVHTDADTKIYVLVATTIEAIDEGAPILVYGRRHADESISADTITGVSLRALGPG